jgi:hypothetical protein
MGGGEDHGRRGGSWEEGRIMGGGRIVGGGEDRGRRGGRGRGGVLVRFSCTKKEPLHTIPTYNRIEPLRAILTSSLSSPM